VICSVMYNSLLVTTLLKSSSLLRLMITISCCSSSFQARTFCRIVYSCIVENLGATASHAREGAYNMAGVTELSFQNDTLEIQTGRSQTAWQPYSSYSTVRAFVILLLL
jgi:hypothetical protein